MRLVPEHLGQLRVHMDLRAGGAVRIDVGSAEARRLLSDSAGELKAALRDRGVTIESVSVRLEATLADHASRPDTQRGEGAEQWGGGGSGRGEGRGSREGTETGRESGGEHGGREQRGAGSEGKHATAAR